jgi:anti-sigma-K factor RskA
MQLLRHDLHALTGAYALDALDDGAEQDRFARHLRRCQSCAGEVRGLREVATALAFAAAAEPPAELRERVLAAAARTRQLPPETSKPAWWRRWLSWLSWMPSTTWMPRLAAVTAVVAVAVAVILGITVASTQQQLNSERAQSRAIAAVLAAPDVRTLAKAATVGGTATVVVSPAKRELVVSTEGLPPLPAGKVYQLWLIGPPAVRSAGLLPGPAAGQTAPVLASGLARGDVLGMTVEPAGGTTKPTTTPILLVTLPA